MRFTLKNSKFIQKVALGSTAIAAFAGVGLADSPAQAGNIKFIPTQSTLETLGGTTPPEYWQNGQLAYDNPLVVLESVAPGEIVTLEVAYLGDGTANLNNQFQWLDGSGWGGGTFNFLGTTPNACSPSTSCWTGPYTGLQTVTYTNNTSSVQNDVPLPFQYLADNFSTNPIPNGDTRDSADFPHYLAVLSNDPNPSNVPVSNLTGKVLGLGLSDRPREPVDNDASDSNVKITVTRQDMPKKTPEPASVLALLGVASLGLSLKRKQQRSE